MAPQFEPSGVQRIGGGGDVPSGTAEDGTGLAGNGSSIVSRASDSPVASGSRRPLTFVFRVKVIQYSGIASPCGVGVPPEQFNIKSPACSAMPSARTTFGTSAGAP